MFASGRYEAVLHVQVVQTIQVVRKTEFALLQLMRFTTKWGKGCRRKREAKMGLPYVDKKPMQKQPISF